MTKKPVTVFYSWQLWTKRGRNRDFIEEVLSQTIEQIEEVQIIIDRDTKDLPGAPAIADSILAKIEQCDIFLADVTLVISDEEHTSPNPNVMLELGYAVRSIGWNRIIMVMNEAFGVAKLLPFDLVHRRWPVTYNLEHGQEKANVREQLIGGLRDRIQLILNAGLPEGNDTPVELTERFIERNELVSLDRLMRNQIEEGYEKINTEEFFKRRGDIQERNRSNQREMWDEGIKLYFEECEAQLGIFVSLTWYGNDLHTKYVEQSIKRWIELGQNNPQPYMQWKYIPSLLMIYAVGIASLANGKWSFLTRVFKGEKIQHPAASDIFEYPASILVEVLIPDHWEAQRAYNSTRGYPIGTYFRKLLRPIFMRFIPSDDDYTHAFQMFEFMLTIYFLYTRRQSNNHNWVFSIPRDAIYGDVNARYYREERLLNSLEMWGEQGSDWELLKEGLFNGSEQNFLKAIQDYQQELSQTSHGKRFGVSDYAKAYQDGFTDK